VTRARAAARRPIDWADVKRRLAAAGRAVETGAALTPDAAALVLEARARKLARPSAPASPEAAGLALATFVVGNEIYAAEARGVRGVFRLTDLAPLPGAGVIVAGVTVWRGELLLVLDLSRVLGLGTTGLDDRAWVVAIGDERRSRGLLAGALKGVISVAEADVKRPKADQSWPATPYLRGVTSDATQVLDAGALLALET
jgi:chemotaxis signal transduction protein